MPCSLEYSAPVFTYHFVVVRLIACVTLPECSPCFCVGVQHSCPIVLLVHSMPIL